MDNPIFCNHLGPLSYNSDYSKEECVDNPCNKAPSLNGCELEGENKPFESNIYDLIKKRIIKDAGNAPENSKMVKNNDNTITVTRIDKNI